MAEMSEKRPVLRTPSGGSRERPHSVPTLDLDRCLQTLRQARSDSEQFAALLLVTKMVQAQETDAATRRKIFDAVGFTFPNRLLKSGGPEGDIYRALGVTIFSCFCTDSQLVLHHHVTSKIPLFNDIIIEPPGSSADDQVTHHTMVEDCYQCLLAIGATPAGRTQLINRDSVPVLCQAVSKKMYGYGQAMQIMRQLLCEHGRELWNKHGDALTNLLTNMANEFSDADDISKFVLCEDLVLLLSGRDKDSGDFLQYTWAEDVLTGLSDILGSYIGPEQRNPALELASLMLDHLGIEWAMSANVKFVLLLVNLACVEVRMVLEDPDVKQVLQKSSLMCACYNILESAIMYTSCTPDLPLDPKQIEQLVESLQGAYVGVTFFLAQIAEQPQDTWFHPLVTASVRVLGAWLAEETSALREEVYRILPFLVKLGSLSLETSEDQSTGAAGVSSLSQEMEELDLYKEKEPYLPKSGVLSFLLPGLCHLTAETRPRGILMQLQVHQVLARCLQLHLSCFLSTKAHEAEMALRTLCGIFLNLLVLSPEHVTSHPNMAALLHRIMGAVPQLGCPDHTVLLANFVVLCLMQARHVTDLQETSVTRQFFCTAVQFLGGAYHVTHGGEQKHLSVSPAYSQHWDSISELWFLGMQALVSCIPQLPWLPAIFLETGLMKNVVALLQDIPGGEFDLDTVDLYQNMVVEVAKHDGRCRQWLQQNGGLEVARSLGMAELLQCLQSAQS
ncbi:neurochondrin-like isoform X2 [Branchiostoma floridae x Branchiostoma belcheri]